MFIEIAKADFEDQCNDLKEKFNAALDRTEELTKELANFNKDEEIAKRDQEIQNLKENPIIFSEKQRKNNQDFIAKHKEKCYNNHEHYIYDVEFAPEETKVKIKCPICQEEINL